MLSAQAINGNNASQYMPWTRDYTESIWLLNILPLKRMWFYGNWPS